MFIQLQYLTAQIDFYIGISIISDRIVTRCRLLLREMPASLPPLSPLSPASYSLSFPVSALSILPYLRRKIYAFFCRNSAATTKLRSIIVLRSFTSFGNYDFHFEIRISSCIRFLYSSIDFTLLALASTSFA